MATTLIGATAAVSAVFAVLGVNSDRIWVLLDDSTAKILVWFTVAFALAAITAGLFALDVRRRQHLFLVVGSFAFIGSLTFAVLTAATGANQLARPSFTKVTVEGSSSASPTVAFTVRAQSLDRGQRIGVRVIDPDTDRLLFDAMLMPDETGAAEQAVSVPVHSGVDAVVLAAWHRDHSRYGSEDPVCTNGAVPDGTSCVEVRF